MTKKEHKEFTYQFNHYRKDRCQGCEKHVCLNDCSICPCYGCPYGDACCEGPDNNENVQFEKKTKTTFLIDIELENCTNTAVDIRKKLQDCIMWFDCDDSIIGIYEMEIPEEDEEDDD